MACNYADNLSPYTDKGRCGLPEIFDDEEAVIEKVKLLAKWIQTSKHVVVHTGAGISTTAGIPDFRGPQGVWTLEKKGEKPQFSISFDLAKPTITHMALVALQKRGLIHYVVSQNVDGLHLKSGFPRSHLSELHGNMFIEQCDLCERQFVRNSAVTTMGQKCLNKPCPARKSGGRSCRGKLFDTILDWEAELPYKDLELADKHSRAADLSLCLGSTLQIVPSGTLPLHVKKDKGRLAICNLQPTKYDNKADLVIHTYVDDFISLLCKFLDVQILDYEQINDPTFLAADEDQKEEGQLIEWTIPVTYVKRKGSVKRKVEERECTSAESNSGSRGSHKLIKSEINHIQPTSEDVKCMDNKDSEEGANRSASITS